MKKFNKRYQEIVEAFKVGSADVRAIAKYVKETPRPASKTDIINMLAALEYSGMFSNGTKVIAMGAITDSAGILITSENNSDLLKIHTLHNNHLVHTYAASTDWWSQIKNEILPQIKKLRPNITDIEFGKQYEFVIHPALRIAGDIKGNKQISKAYINGGIKRQLLQNKDYEIITYFSHATYPSLRYPGDEQTLVLIQQEFKETPADETESIYKLAVYRGGDVYPFNDKDYKSVQEAEEDINSSIRNYIPEFNGYKFNKWIPVGYVDHSFRPGKRDNEPDYAILDH